LLQRIPVSAPDIGLLAAIFQQDEFAIRMKLPTSSYYPPLDIYRQFNVNPECFQHLAHLLRLSPAPNDEDHDPLEN
jgi:hypothetical protein